MKKSIVICLPLFLALMTAVSCGKKLATEPSYPATKTPVCTQTVTFTATAFLSATPTMESTPADTATGTAVVPLDTQMPTMTATDMDTGTETATASDTDTVTETVTDSVTATVTCTSTDADTATFTFTPTSVDTATCTATVTSTSTPHLPPYTFDDNTESWLMAAPLSAANPASLGFTWAGYNTAPADIHSGTGSYQVNVNMTSVTASKRGDVSIDFGSAVADMSGKTLTVWVEVPASVTVLSPPYCMQAFIATSASSAFSVNVTMTASGWQQMSFPLPVPAWAAATEYVGLRMKKTNGSTTPDWAGTLFFDDISW